MTKETVIKNGSDIITITEIGIDIAIVLSKDCFPILVLKDSGQPGINGPDVSINLKEVLQMENLKALYALNESTKKK